jgi:Ca-activated chloride channel family protein
MGNIFSIALILMLSGFVQAQSAHKELRKGDLFYDQGEFLEAEEAYRKSNAKETNAQAQYNLGNSIYQQERYDEAVQHFESAAQKASDPFLKAQAYHNLGNTHFKAQALDKSIDAYRNALKLNPADLDTKKNLTMALQQLRQQQQREQQRQQGGSQEQEKQEQQQQQQQQEQQQQQQQQQQQSQLPQEQQTGAGEDLTKKEAEELLKVIDSEDRRVQEKMQKATLGPKKPTKDW